MAYEVMVYKDKHAGHIYDHACAGMCLCAYRYACGHVREKVVATIEHHEDKCAGYICNRFLSVADIVMVYSHFLYYFFIYGRNRASRTRACHVYIYMYVDMCVDLCTGMCIDMCTDMCVYVCKGVVDAAYYGILVMAY